jgi:hypothetical protein
MMVAPVAPAEDVNAIRADIGQGRRLGEVVGHPDRVVVIRARRKVRRFFGGTAVVLPNTPKDQFEQDDDHEHAPVQRIRGSTLPLNHGLHLFERIGDLRQFVELLFHIVTLQEKEGLAEADSTGHRQQ